MLSIEELREYAGEVKAWTVSIGCENSEVRISQHHKLFDMECDVSYKIIG